MMERLLEQKMALITVLESRNDLLPENGEWSLMQELIKFLQPFKVTQDYQYAQVFKEMTEFSCSESNVTISYILPSIARLKKHFLVIGQGDSQILRSIKNAMATDLQQRWIKFKENNICAKATALDPRFKKLDCLENQYTFSIWKSLEEEMVKLSSNVEEEVEESGSVEHVSKKRKDYNARVIYLFGEEATRDQPIQRTAHQEIEMYKMEPSISFMNDPLEWWNNTKIKYPLLSQLARRYLALPATSVRSERTFSLAGQIITPRRNCLSSDIVDMLIFLNDFHKQCNKQVNFD
jgi:hypothetical protein